MEDITTIGYRINSQPLNVLIHRLESMINKIQYIPSHVPLCLLLSVITINTIIFHSLLILDHYYDRQRNTQWWYPHSTNCDHDDNS